GSAAEDWSALLSGLARLYLARVRVDWDGFDRGYRRRKMHLPTYPFERRRCWLETGPAADAGAGQGALPAAGPGPRFTKRLRPASEKLVSDHRVHGRSLFPASGFLDVALTAARRELAQPVREIAEVVVRRPLVISGEEEVIVEVLLEPAGPAA